MVGWVVVGRVGAELNIREDQVRNQRMIVVVFTSPKPSLDLVCMLDTHTLMSGKQSGMSLMAQHTGEVSVAVDKI